MIYNGLFVVLVSAVQQSELVVCVCVCVCVRSLHQLCLTLCDPMDYSPPSSSVHGIIPGKNTGVDCHFQLQGVVSTQGLQLCSLGLLNWQADYFHCDTWKACYTYTYIHYFLDSFS